MKLADSHLAGIDMRDSSGVLPAGVDPLIALRHE
jgi:hypothetical protein